MNQDLNESSEEPLLIRERPSFTLKNYPLSVMGGKFSFHTTTAMENGWMDG